MFLLAVSLYTIEEFFAHGVYGAPETFLVDAGGVIRYKRVGDVNPSVWRDEIAPVVATLAGRADGKAALRSLGDE